MYACIAISLGLAGCSQDPVTVEKFEPVIKSEFFDKGSPPENNDPRHNECANTHFHFSFSPEVIYDDVRREKVQGGEVVEVKIRKVNIKLGLEITKWLPQKPTEDTAAHEDGHVKISLDCYKNAEKVAREAAQSVIGKAVVGRGDNYKNIVMRILSDVDQAMARRYKQETLDKANIISGLYDQMTVKEHPASQVNQKVADAELEFARIEPQLREKRAEEERKLQEQIDKHAVGEAHAAPLRSGK